MKEVEKLSMTTDSFNLTLYLLVVKVSSKYCSNHLKLD